jgi:vesicle-fusing ATPase
MTQLLKYAASILGCSCADILQEILEKGKLFINQVARSTRTPRVSVLLHGPPASGKTVLAVSIAWASKFPFIKLISPDRMVGFSEAQKVQFITRTFNDSYKSPLSVIVVDNLERLLGGLIDASIGHCAYFYL